MEVTVREIVILVFALLLTFWIGSKTNAEIRSDKTRAWKVVVWIFFFLINIWTCFAIIGSWASETFVNESIPLSLFPFYNSVIDGLLVYFNSLWDWITTR
ncbi:hypothetical protein H7Y40_01460 [Pedobacter sp.]|nr:hypothetical protein [Candidatus Saccharibacteria bacterium]